jgi:chromosome segregation ATPase
LHRNSDEACGSLSQATAHAEAHAALLKENTSLGGALAAAQEVHNATLKENTSLGVALAAAQEAHDAALKENVRLSVALAAAQEGVRALELVVDEAKGERKVLAEDLERNSYAQSQLTSACEQHSALVTAHTQQLAAVQGDHAAAKAKAESRVCELQADLRREVERVEEVERRCQERVDVANVRALNE